MFLHCLTLALVYTALCVDIDITGELMFDLRVTNREKQEAVEEPQGVSGEGQHVMKISLKSTHQGLNNDPDNGVKKPGQDWRKDRVHEDDISKGPEDHKQKEHEKAPSSFPIKVDKDDSDQEKHDNLKVNNQDKEVDGENEDQEEKASTTNLPVEKTSKTVSEVTSHGNVTVVPSPAATECVYQYPEAKQVDAMLSDMTNKLTRVFVRINKFMRTTRMREKEKRFRVVDKKRSDFFDQIFYNMTQEYKGFYNASAAHALRLRREPCAHQGEVKRVWRALLAAAQRAYRAAALRCVEEYVRVRARAHEPRARSRLTGFLLKELGAVRAAQLGVLCNSFQLCYNDLL